MANDERARTTTRCWCGATDLRGFSAEYLRCDACGTLVLAEMPDVRDLQVRDDERDFYGRRYYESHLTESYSYPPLVRRARTDLPDRCVHWLQTLLQFKLPPARILELGSAHGAFVSLMRLAGFDATGLELSAWLAGQARKFFDIPILVGPVEEQQIPPGSLDGIVLMDVLEHLPDPVATIRHCATLLRPDGLFLLQTPEYREGVSYQNLIDAGDPFTAQFKIPEHLYLFSRRSVGLLFERVGFPHVVFEPAVFGFYDMCLLAGRASLPRHTNQDIEQCVSRAPSGRMALAMLDLYASLCECKDRSVPELRRVAAERLEALERADAMLQAAQAEVKQLDLVATERLQVLVRADALLGEAQRARIAEVAQLQRTAAERLEALGRADTMLKRAEADSKEFESAAAERLAALVRADEQIRNLHTRLNEEGRRAELAERERADLALACERMSRDLDAMSNETVSAFLARRWSHFLSKRTDK